MTPFEWAYRSGTPPWDIGRSQGVFERLEAAGEIAGRVLDVGCGTGDNAIYLASRGYETWGVDSAPTAIAAARRKARGRGVRVTFVDGDALDLESLGRTFDTVVDCGFFHTLDDVERLRFAAGLEAALVPGGRYHMLCFSELQPGEYGPRRVTQPEIRATFGKGFHVDSIREAAFETAWGHPAVRAWLASLTRR